MSSSVEGPGPAHSQGGSPADHESSIPVETSVEDLSRSQNQSQDLIVSHDVSADASPSSAITADSGFNPGIPIQAGRGSTSSQACPTALP